MTHTFIVHNDNIRLDIFLVSQLPKLSRNAVQRLVKKGSVYINNNPVKKSGTTVHNNNVVVVQVEDKREGDDINLIKSVKMDFEILYQSNDIVIINKPVGIAVHPSKNSDESTIVNGLFYQFPNFRGVGEFPSYGLVHRLDKDTSGVLIIALTNEALWFLKRQFERREVKKEYLAAVYGNISNLFRKKKTLIISNFIGRNSKNRKKMAVVKPEYGRLATTYVSFIKTGNVLGNKKASLLLVYPKTGRMHQIRVHLANLGFPIIGDTLYSRGHFIRMMLHAYRITVKMLDGKMQTFSAPLPGHFIRLFCLDKKLGKNI
jgi:23S rRNA pseudouridine1911/1915/1917 synthase